MPELVQKTQMVQQLQLQPKKIKPKRLVVYNLWVLAHFVPWGIFWLVGISTFWLKKPEKKNV